MTYLSKEDVAESWNKAVANDNVVSIKFYPWWARVLMWLRLMKRPKITFYVTKSRPNKFIDFHDGS